MEDGSCWTEIKLRVWYQELQVDKNPLSVFQGEAVHLIEEGKAPRVPQWEGGATYDQIWKKKEVAEISWDKSALGLHNFIRGNDKLPGAWSKIDGKVCLHYDLNFELLVMMTITRNHVLCF